MMRKRSPLTSHLYGQIVLPLLIASVLVGALVSLVAVFFLEDLTDRWVTETARKSTANLASQVVDYAQQMERETRIAAMDEEIRASAEAGDLPLLRAALVVENTSLDFDSMMILDATGRVEAVTGSSGVRYGDRPLGSAGAWGIGRPRTMFAEYDGKMTITTMRSIAESSGGHTLAISRVVDARFLQEMGIGEGNAYCFFDDAGRRITCAMSDGMTTRQRARLEGALTEPGEEVRAVLAAAENGAQAIGSVSVGTSDYTVSAQRVALAGTSGLGAYGYVLGTVDHGVSVQAGHTTRNLITMWSVVAVVALVGMGGWVARRVSDPLIELSAGARRIADGDFSTKVHVSSSNEIGQLADTFNEMTDSLRERSESLTKKVLELATLYEMSRALGSTLDMDELLGSVLDSALRIFDLDLGYVVLRDKETESLSVRAIRGVQDADADGAVRSSMSEWVVREGRPLIFNPDAGSASEQIDAVTGAKAALCVPLVSTEGTIGSITIGSSDIDYRFHGDDVRLLSTIANHVTIAVGNIELFSSLQEAYLATVRSLAAAVDAKDSYTRGHSEYVAEYATLIADRMGLPADQKVALEMAAYLHDIGKIGVSEEILLKPGKLNDEEMAQMRHHPLIGANILKPVAFPWAITPVVRHHHEAWDGTGYPAGLKGEEIPLLARILSVADSYEAMTADRPYREGRTAREALEELAHCADAQFDGRIVKLFTEAIIEQVDPNGGAADSVSEDVAPEEARAIFAVLTDGILLSFRRLGGPRLASNVESEIDAYFASQSLPFRIARGRLSFTEDPPARLDGELDQMRAALVRIDAVIGELSGVTLVEHFYDDALSGLSSRMRALARDLGFFRG